MVFEPSQSPGSHTLSSSQGGGRRVSGEAGGVPRAEVPGVGGVLSRLPDALWR